MGWGFEDEVREGWRVRKEISLGDVLAIVVCLSTVAAAFYHHDTRIAILERDISDLRSWKQEIREDLRDIKAAIVEIRDRLGRK